jgi:undecaprenyl-diphosphatase
MWVTQLGNPYIWLILSTVFLLIGNNKRIALILIISLMFGIIIVDNLKEIVQRDRPPGDLSQYFIFSPGYSFPSGHAYTAFLIAVLLGAFLDKRYRMIGYALAFIVCISRIQLGVHYPSDVIAGAILGALTGELILISMDRIGFIKKDSALKRYAPLKWLDKAKSLEERIITGLATNIRKRSNYIYALLAAGMLVVIVSSLLQYFDFMIAAMALMFISMIYILASNINDEVSNKITAAAIIALGLLSSVSITQLKSHALSLLIITVTFIAIFTLPALNKSEKNKKNLLC